MNIKSAKMNLKAIFKRKAKGIAHGTEGISIF